METAANSINNPAKITDKTLAIYADKLINLNGRNALIWMSKPSKTKHLDIGSLNFLTNAAKRTIVTSIWDDKKIRLFEHTDARSEATTKASSTLKTIQRNTKQIEEESGSYDLKLAFPFVIGRMANGTTIHAPLMLFPVELSVEKNYWVLKPKENEPAEINKSFLLSYQQNNGLANIADEILNLSSEDIIDENNYFIVNLYNKLKEANIDIRIKNTIYEDKIETYQSHTKETFEKVFSVGNLEMIDEAVIGIFPQAGGYLVSDYNELKKDNSININTIFSKFNKHIEEEGYLLEQELMMPLPCDASQETIIKKVISKQSLVVQGPPGTGKSQLIANLVADALYKGKKVLVVCQKRAALEVVKERLGSINLNDYLGLVQDLQHDRQSLFEQIDRQITNYIEKPRSLSDSNNFSILQEKYFHSSKRIDEIHKELLLFQQELSKIQDCEFNVKELYLNSNRKEQQLLVAEIYKYFNKSKLNTFINKIERLEELKQNYPKVGIWKELKNLNFLTENTALSELNAFRSSINWFNKENAYLKLLSNTFNEEIAFINKLFSYIDNDSKAIDLFSYWQKNNYTSSELHTSLEEIKYYSKKNCLQDLDHLRFEIFEQKARKYLPSIHNAHFIFNHLEDSDFLQFLEEALEVLNIEKQKSFKAEEVNEIINNRTTLNKLYQKFCNYHLNSLNTDWNALIENFEKSIEIYKSYFERNDLVLRFINSNDGSILKGYEKLKVFLKEFKEHYLISQKWLEENKLKELLTFSNAEISALSSELAEKLRFWFEYDDTLHHFDTEEKQAYQYFLEDNNLNRFKRVFTNSIYIAWIEKIEFENPALKSADFLEAEKRDSLLQQLIEEKQHLSRVLLPAYLNAMVENLVPVQHREKRSFFNKLLREVRKKSHRWPIRRLLNTYEMEMNALIPCWLATPEMVSALFTLNQTFDLVIFDEASQCFAERGIPAIYRAKQLVVAGDDKQLQPNRMFSSTLSVDEDDLELNEEEIGTINIESLLKLCSNFLTNDTLKQHYRSRTIDLIAFSNAKFYDSKLQMIPHFHTVQNKEVNLQFIKVNGVWESNANLIEAEKVVELLKEINTLYPSKSVGIVCFNIHQQNLLMDLIEQSEMNLPPQLFVKNIENVQGDERDIIILSVTYAYDSKGKFNRHFGDLSQQGGENKLNVAITRSRERMIVVSSISHNDIGQANSNGGRLLSEFLAFLEMQSKQSDQFGALKNLGSLHSLEQNALAPILADVVKKELKSLPFADLSLQGDDERYLLVYTDDLNYQRERNLKQRHAYLPIQLQGKGWQFRKVYSRQWWSNPEGVIKHLE